MQGRGQPEWRESGGGPPVPQEQPALGKHVSFHESVKQRRPHYEYQPPPSSYGPPPSQHRQEYTEGGGRWVYEPGPRPSWPPEPHREYYDSPPRPEIRQQQRYSGPPPPSPRGPFLPSAPTSPGFRRAPEREQLPYRPPRIPYRRPPPVPPSPGELGYPSPKRQRTQPPKTVAVHPPRSVSTHIRENSLNLLAKVAMQGDEPNQQQQPQNSVEPPHRGVVPPSPSSPPEAPQHTRAPSWQSLKSPLPVSHGRSPSWQLQWMSPENRHRRDHSRDYPVEYRYVGAPQPPEPIQQIPSWGSTSPTVVERALSFDATESPPRQHVRTFSGAFPYGYYSPEGLTYNTLGSPLPRRYQGYPRAPRTSELPPWQTGGSYDNGYVSHPPEQPTPYPPHVNHVSPGSHYADQPPPLHHSPYSYVQQPQLEEKTILRKKFSWKHYPELERFLIDNRDEYLRHSAMNYTAKQKHFNNWLTEEVVRVASRNGYEFDSQEFNFVGIRDRIRCYYKSYVQTARKKGIEVMPPRVQAPEEEEETKGPPESDQHVLTEQVSESLEKGETSEHSARTQEQPPQQLAAPREPGPQEAVAADLGESTTKLSTPSPPS